MIRNILVFLFYFSYIQASYCQSLSINNILEESYSNFIKLCLPNWLSNHKIKYFYLLETYNPVGFNSDKITNNVVNKKTDLKLNYKGQIIYEKGYRKNNYYIGYPDIFMIGPDTIGVNISLSYFNNQRSSAFAGSFISLFKISIYNDGFSEIKLSQDSINNIIKNAKLNKQIIGLDSIYIKAIKLAITNLDYDNILIYDKYFPMWVLLSDSMKPYRHLYITHIKKHQRLNNKLKFRK